MRSSLSVEEEDLKTEKTLNCFMILLKLLALKTVQLVLLELQLMQVSCQTIYK